jgi:hypothetical protein
MLRLLAACSLLLSALLLAQDDLMPKPRPKVFVSMAPAATVTVTPGRPAYAQLQFRVNPGYHINSHKPTSELLIATALKLDAQTGLVISKITYPEGENLTFPFAPDEKLNVYTGDFAISAQVSAARSTPPGRYRIHGRLVSQACDNKACYPPKNLPVAFDVQVLKAPVTRTRRNPGQSPHVH